MEQVYFMEIAYWLNPRFLTSILLKLPRTMNLKMKKGEQIKTLLFYCCPAKTRTLTNRTRIWYATITPQGNQFCVPAGIRTQDPILKRDVLYLLSY